MYGMMRNAYYSGIIIIILIISGCSDSENKLPEQSRKQRPATLVKVQIVEQNDIKQTLELPGTLEPLNIANVLSTTEGKITELGAREGDVVIKGEIIAMLSPLLREDIIAAARLTLNEKEQELKQNPEDENLQKEMEQVESDYKFAIKQYREIPVIAPINGVVSERWIDIGDMVSARHKMFEIQNNNQFIVKVPVSELDIRKLRVGQFVNIFSDACPGRDYKGRIQRIHPKVEQQTRNAILEVLLHDPCPQLKSGMFVRVLFTTDSEKNVVVIPLSAIVNKEQKQSVFVVNEDIAHQIVVETGIESNEMIEIISGLNPGDTLVVEGQELLQPDIKVRIHKDSNIESKNPDN